MKKAMFIFLAFAMVLTVAGCKKGPAAPTSELPTGQPKEIPMEVPTAASETNTMPIEELLAIVNTALESDEEGNTVFRLEDAEAMEIPSDNEVLYVFSKADCEIVLFASYDAGNFLQAYFRTEYSNEISQAYMLSFAGVFLMALEPKEYENMLLTVAPFLADEEGAEPKIEEEASGEDEEDHVHSFEEGVSCEGEHWTLTYRSDLVNINPR